MRIVANVKLKLFSIEWRIRFFRTTVAVGTSISLLISGSLPANGDDGPNGPHKVKPDYGFASWYSDEYGEMCWRDRSTITSRYLSFVGKGAKQRPDFNNVKAGAFKVLGADIFDFQSCGQSDYGNLEGWIFQEFENSGTYDGNYPVLFLATTSERANTWYINPDTTYNKKKNEDLDSYFPPDRGDDTEQHLQYFNGKKWVSMWSCNAWFTLYDRNLNDVRWIATRKSEFDIPKTNSDKAQDAAWANTIWDGLCGKVPSKVGTYKYKLRMHTPTYDYVECKRDYSTWYCSREYNNKKYVSLKGKIKIVKNKNGEVKVSYLSK